MKNRFNKGFEETKQNKVPKYGIRKLKVGVVSCLLAFSMFAPAVGAHAEGPVHVDLHTKTKAEADKLYDDVNTELKNIAAQISTELEGIQQLEANIDKAQADADAAQKAEENAKKDLVQKRADYEAKKKEYAEAEAKLKQRKAEEKAAKKRKEKAKEKYDDADKKRKIADDDFNKHAEKPLTAEDTNLVTTTEATKKQKEEALKDLEDDNAIYEEYKEGDRKVTNKDDLKDNDDIVIAALKNEEEVKQAIITAKGAIKYADDASTCEKAKEAINQFNTDLTAFKGAHSDAANAGLKSNNDGFAEWKDGSGSAKNNDKLNSDIVVINKCIKDEKDAINFDSDVQGIKTARANKLNEAKGKAFAKIPNEKKDTTVAKKEADEAKEAYELAQHVVDVKKNVKKDSAEKRLGKAEQKKDDAQDALDKASDAYETAKDNLDAAQDKYDLAKAAKDSACTAKDTAHKTLTDAHGAFRDAKESLRLTIKVAKTGDKNKKAPEKGKEKDEKPEEKAERLGIEGLRNEVAKQLKDAEDAYGNVERVVTSKKDRIKLLQDLVASTRKFAAMASNTDAAKSFDGVIDKYNDEIEGLSDEVADYSEKLAESTALITVIRQLAEKAKVLKPRNLKPEGWSQEGTDWTYTDSIGMTVKDNWVQGKNGDWFYLDGFGKMAHDKWVEVNKKWFYAGSNGVIAQEQWIQNKLGDWFYVKKGGYMAQNEWVQVKGQWYYAQKDGNMAKNVTLNVNGVNYSFNANCAWVK